MHGKVQQNSILPRCTRSKASHEYSTETRVIYVYVVPHSHHELGFSANVRASWKDSRKLTRALGLQDMNVLLCETRAHETTNAFASRVKRVGTKP